MTYIESVDYIVSLCLLGSLPGFERIKALCALLGEPQNNLHFVHVTGTKGKGSVCAMFDSVLLASGMKTGRYTSPHTECYNERISINGESISDENFAALVTFVREKSEKLDSKLKPTEFEFLTAAAFLYFKQQDCDIVLLEVGMGGLLDATNIITPESLLLSIITRVGKDHTRYLGNTVEEIAVHKAGIIKTNRPVLYGGSRDTQNNDTNIKRIIEAIAKARGSDFYDNTEFLKTTIISEAHSNGCSFDVKGFENVRLNTGGIFQVENAVTAIRASLLLKELYSFPITDTSIRKGLSNVRINGRFEILSDNPLFVIDCAHNPDGAKAAAYSIKQSIKAGKVILISGVLADKDYNGIIEEIKDLCAIVLTVTPDNPRALSALLYAERFSEKGIPALPSPSYQAGVEAAFRLTQNNGLPIVALGSFYIYSGIKKAVEAYQRNK